jgi:hypothetical protein
MKETGPLYDARAVVYHVLNDTRNRNGDVSWPMMALGGITVAIGATIVWTTGKKMWAEKVKEQARETHAGKR